MSQRESRDKKRKRNAAYQSRSASPNTNNNNNTNKNIQSPLLKRQRSNNSNNVKYNSSHFQSNNFINKLQNRTNTNSSTTVNSTAATSPSSTTPPTPPKNCKDQKKISTLIPKTYKNYEKFKKIYIKKLNGDNMYQELHNKIIECNKQLNKSNEELSSVDLEENDDDICNIEAELKDKIHNLGEQMSNYKKQILSLENRYQNKYIDNECDFIVTHTENAASVSIFNTLNNKNIVGSRKCSTKHVQKTKDAILFQMEIGNKYNLLKEIKEQGEDHKQYKDLKATWDAKFKDKKCSLLQRNYVLKSSKLMIKILENKNNKYAFDLIKEKQRIKYKMMQTFSPDLFADISNNNEIDIENLNLDNKTLFVISKLKYNSTKWNAIKSTFDEHLTEEEIEKKDENDNAYDPTPSLSCEPVPV